MKFFHIIAFLALFLSFHTTPLAAQEQGESVARVETITDEIYQNLKNNKFDLVEQKLQQFITKNTQTRNGTDMTNTVLAMLVNKIGAEEGETTWIKTAEEWVKKSPNLFLSSFFLEQLQHQQAWTLKNDPNWDEIPQNIRRKHLKTLNEGQSTIDKIIEKNPNEWRLKAYISNKYNEYGLSTEYALSQYLQPVQKAQPFEITSLKGYIASLSPDSLGHNDTAISIGIENILKKYPKRNLSKPEYLDDAVKKEIEDEIFEYAIRHMLSQARKINDEAPETAATATLIPMSYSIIYEDLKKHYGENAAILNTHPLSYQRQEVWNEITASYKTLQARFPKSGEYLSDYLDFALKTENTTDVKNILNTIYTNDPTFSPKRLRPIQCDYYSKLIGDERTKENNTKMYNSCNEASQYEDNVLFHYRAGWAARQNHIYDKSNEHFENALRLDPKNDIYLTDICWNYKDIKSYDKALDYCDKAIAINRKNARAWLGRSHIYYYGFNNVAQSQKDAMMYEHYKDEETAQ